MPASLSKKPSDRTHEENQERAYIAASRRSDRSVEARVESARRASEIHKRRTGKALKVTEKDVLAEEMYEEEEEALPAQYQNLNAHLQTGSTDFDARLQAYLANAVAFRKALSGVTKSRDKADNVDFVNTKQLADHQALFPKHSDAWKDVMIPKTSRDSTTTPFLPQEAFSNPARKISSTPYDSKSSGLSSRRMSATLSSMDSPNPMTSMGTLRASDLKPRTTTYRPAARHPSLPQPKMPSGQQQSLASYLPEDNLESAGINYASLDQSSMTSGSAGVLSESPFSSKLPANTLDMLLPWNHLNDGVSELYNNSFLYDTSLFHPKPEDTIDATLLAPTSSKMMPSSALSEYAPQSVPNWSQTMFKESSANRMLAEDNMWGNFIDDTSTGDAWDWSIPC